MQALRGEESHCAWHVQRRGDQQNVIDAAFLQQYATEGRVLACIAAVLFEQHCVRWNTQISQEGGAGASLGIGLSFWIANTVLPAKRGTDGRGVTIDMPLAPLMALPLRDLTAPVIEAWAAKEAQTRPTSARLAWRLLKGFLSWCDEQPAYAGLLPLKNPAKTKKSREAFGKAAVKQDALLREQLAVWFDAVQKIQNPVIAAYLQTMLLTGARPGEVLALRWEDLNTKWKGLTIRDKVEGERVIPLTPYVGHLLAGLPRRNEWVFSSTRAVSMDDKNVLRRARRADGKGVEIPVGDIVETSATGHITMPRSYLHCACTVAGIEGLTLHGLRRSFKSLTEWLEIPAGVVAQLMGHKPSATAEKHYTVRPLDLLRVHHEKIEAWILEQAGIVFDAKAVPGALRVVTA